ncbi:hypothetical protein M9Y10_008722 [Tritrichomonas musculus]|uniref:Uncharacterized protein n=1 Tax=Tritrichomonas musculus TaxID=1915356 RepID=A0ABR2IZZ8_9EUKA
MNTKDQIQLKLILNSKVFKIPNQFHGIADITKDIYSSLMFGTNQYMVYSKVSEEVFQSFLNYWIKKEEPEITIDNIKEYDMLSREFGIMKKILIDKRKILGEYYIDINDLADPKIKDKSHAEEMIAIRLDDFLLKSGKSLISQPIRSLYNIFNHQKRNLTNHNLAYELIIDRYEELKAQKNKNYGDILILLNLLDGTKLNSKNFKDSIQNCERRFGMIPTIDFKFICDIKEEIHIFKKKRKSLEQSIEQNFENFKREQNNKMERMQNEINQKLSSIEHNLDEKLKKFDQEQNKKNDIIINIINNIIADKEKQEKLINDLSQKIDNLNKKYSELETSIKINNEKQNKNNQLLDSKIENLKKDQIKYTQIKTAIDELRSKLNQNQNDLKNNETIINSIQKKGLNLTNTINHINKTYIEIANKISKYSNNQEIMFSLMGNYIYGQSIYFIPDNIAYFHESISKERDGILSTLKKHRKDPFERHFIVSLSHRDPYNLLNYNSDDIYCSTYAGDLCLEFTFKDPINLTEFQITGSNGYYPRSYDIIINNSNSPFHVIDDTQMRDEPHISRQKLNVKNCKSFKFVQKGPNWDSKIFEANFLEFKQIEFFTEENKNGLIKRWNDLNKEKNPHLFPIIVDSNQLSTEDIHINNSKKTICPGNSKNEYCEIQFINGAITFDGYRLKRSNYTKKMNGWFLTGKTLLDEVINLSEYSDTSNNTNLLYVSKDINNTALLKSITLHKSLNKSNSSNFLHFKHFEIFGSFIKL